MKLITLAFLTFPVTGPAQEVTFHDRHFQVAAGYTLEVAVPPTLVQRPIEADFDAKGRLFVSESSGSNAPAEEQLKQKPHRLYRLQDTNGDGVYDEKTLFADELMFPEGVLCYGGSVYVAAPPQIWKFTDADDDGKAEQREVWYDGKTLTGCANDLHGPYLGPDGLIYWCKGAFAEQTHALPAKPNWHSRASHVFRMKPDGTAFDCVFTAGMDNPVGLAWTPEGDLMVSGTFLQQPADGKRDGIIHAVRGGVWGKDHAVLAEHPRTGDLLPPMTHLGPAAAAGMCRYGRDLLVAQFNLHQVSRHQLIPQGGSYRTVDSNLLVSDHPDFHPTDVLQAPDGSILVVDTGGWYKLCCPTSQLAKPAVPGAIYRLRKVGGEIPLSTPPPSWKLEPTADLPPLIKRSQDVNLHLRRAAIEQLGLRLAAKALADETEQIMTALGASAQLPDVDRFLEHALIYAMMECRDHSLVKAAALHPHAAWQRMGLIALSQTDPSQLSAADIGSVLQTKDAGVRDAFYFGLARSVAWRDAAKAWLAEHLATQPEDILLPLINGFATRAPELLPDLGVLLGQATTTATRQNLLNAMRVKTSKEPWPAAWTDLLVRSLDAHDPAEARAAAEDAAVAVFASETPALRTFHTMALDPARPAMIRLLLLSNPTISKGTRDEVNYCFSQITEQADLEARLLAARTLGKWILPEATLTTLAGKLGSVSALERPLLLKAFQQGGTEPLGMAVAAQLEAAGILPTLPETLLNECFAKFPPAVLDRLTTARNAGRQDWKAQQQKLETLCSTLPPGDAQRGSIVFSSNQASCTLCHQIGYKGGRLGPDLSKVGSIRTRRDLLESIVFPSASFVRSYEPVMVQKTDGSSVLGILRNQGHDQLTLATGPVTPDATIKLTEVKSTTPGEFSLMPAGLDKALGEERLADLVAYLMSLR